MDSKVRRNYFCNLALQILNIIAPIITMPYVSRVLGSAGVGEYSFTYSVVSYYLIFASLGTSLYGCREIARASMTPHKRSVIFFEIISIRLISSTAVVVAYLIMVFNFGFSELDKQLLLISTFYILGTAFDASWFFQGEEDFLSITIFALVIKILTVVSTFFFVTGAGDVYIYVFIHAFMVFANSALYYLKIPKLLERVHISELHLSQHVFPIFVLLVPQVSKEVYCILDKTMIGAFYTDRSLSGFYEQATNIINMSLVALTSLNVVKMSNLSQGMNEEDKEIESKVSKSFHFVWFLGLPICGGLLSAVDLFVPVFFGDGYEPVVSLVYILMPTILIIGISNVIGVQYLITLKRHASFNASIISGLVCNVVLNMILIPRLNVYGAAAATLASEFVVMGVQLIAIRKDVNLSFLIPREIVVNFIGALVMCALVIVIKYGLSCLAVPLLLQLLIVICLAITSYSIIVLALGDNIACSLVTGIKSKMTKRMAG